jgi:putative DNA primase/helicase
MDKAKGERRIMELLAKAGFDVPASPKRRHQIIELLDSSIARRRFVVVSQIGWCGKNFCLPTKIYGRDKKRIRLVLPEGAANHRYELAGTYEQWVQHVALPCHKNRTLLFGLLTAFAPPLVPICNIESGGFQLTGLSSIGKTSSFLTWGSVWGGGGRHGFCETWHGTSNAFDTIAILHRHTPLYIDEAGLAGDPGTTKSGDIIAKAVFQLTAGEAKARQTDTEKRQTWETVFYSSSEDTFSEIAEKAKLAISVGQIARMTDIAADAGKGMGSFEDLHGADDASSFSRALKSAAKTYYGTAADKFLKLLTRDWDKRPKWLRKWLRLRMSRYKVNMPHNHPQGPYQRIGDRFALVYAAGALAARYGVLPFDRAEILKAVRYCHGRAILDELYTRVEQNRSGIDVVREWLRTNIGRFHDVREQGHREDFEGAPGFINRRRRKPEILILEEVFNEIVCKGRDPEQVFNELHKAGLAGRHVSGPYTIHRILPKCFGRARVVCIYGKIIDL